MLSKVAIESAEIQVLDQGTGDPVLFVHGFPLHSAIWRRQVEPVSRTHRLLAVDLRGFGGSTVTPGTVTMEQYADDLAAVLDAMSILEPVTLCCLSMGGYVAWQFWRKYAPRVKSLILCDTRAAADTAEAREARLKMAELVLQKGAVVAVQAMIPKLVAEGTAERFPGVVADLKEIIISNAPEGIAAAQRGMAQRPDVRDLLPTIKVPALLVVGEHDVISPVAEMREISESISGSQFQIVPGAGHMVPMENPAFFNEKLLQFLQSL